MNSWNHFECAWESVCLCLSVYASVAVCHLAFVVCGRDVHLLLDHVVDVGGGAALDPFLLLSLQLVSHHLDGLCPLISEFTTYNMITFKDREATLYLDFIKSSVLPCSEGHIESCNDSSVDRNTPYFWSYMMVNWILNMLYYVLVNISVDVYLKVIILIQYQQKLMKLNREKVSKGYHLIQHDILQLLLLLLFLL